MKAFVERLCEHTVVVRAGPETDGPRAEYDFAVVAKEDGDKAIVKALVAPKPVVWWLRWLFPSRPFTMRHAMAIIRALKDIGLTAVWDGLTRKSWKKKR